MKKNWMVLASVVCLAAQFIIPALAAGGFRDVPENAWYTEAVTEVSAKGYLNGVDEGIFSPTGVVTRAAVVTALWRLEGAPLVSSEGTFSDIASGAWYDTAVSWAKRKNIATGLGDNQFLPNQAVTREQLAQFLYQYTRYKGGELAKGKLELYTDQTSVSSWAVEGVCHAIGAGLIRGTDNRLAPKGTANRAELAAILQRLMTPVMG